MRQINIVGLTFNHCIAVHKRFYRLFGKHIQAYQLMKHLTKLKCTKRFAYMRKLGSQAVQDIAERIDRAYSLFFANLKRKVRTSPPKFKAVRRYKSFTLKQAGWKLDETQGKIRIGTRWYRYFQSPEDRGQSQNYNREAWCCRRYIRLFGSDGHDIVSPYFFMQNVKSIRTKCRKLSRRQKGSYNRERYRKELARAYRKMD